MSVDIVVPTLGESVTEATVARWLKQPGDTVAMDEPLVELETDKVTVEIPSPQAGVLSSILVGEDDTVLVGAVLGRIGEGNGAAAAPAAAAAAAADAATADDDVAAAAAAAAVAMAVALWEVLV